MKHLIIGIGEVGKALHSILRERYEVVRILDISDGPHEIVFDTIHICFPYSDLFITYANDYNSTYLKSNGLCIVHSTVPLGTCESISPSENIVHSPIRGQHPNLEIGIRTFTKYFGGKRSKEAADVFNYIIPDCKRICIDDARTTEALKLWDTAQYAWNILLEKEIHRWCKEHDVDFNLVYTNANHTYNIGYEECDIRQVYKKYVLDHVVGPIGGHCLISNAKLLESWITEIILEMNTTYSKEVDK